MIKLIDLLIENLETITVKTVKYSDLGSNNDLPTDIGRNITRTIKDEDDLEDWRVEFIKKYKIKSSDDVRLSMGTDGWVYHPYNRYDK
jgi:hypothetical protein